MFDHSIDFAGKVFGNSRAGFRDTLTYSVVSLDASSTLHIAHRSADVPKGCCVQCEALNDTDQ